MKCSEAFSKILNRCCCAYIQATWYGASHAPVPGGTPRPLGSPAGFLLLLGRGRRWRPDPSVVGHGELPRQRRLGVIVDHGFDHRLGTGSVLHGDNGCRFSLQGAESNVRLWHATELCDEKTYMYVKCLIMFNSFTGQLASHFTHGLIQFTDQIKQYMKSLNAKTDIHFYQFEIFHIYLRKLLKNKEIIRKFLIFFIIIKKIFLFM